MKLKNWWLVIAACLLLILVYVSEYKAGYKSGENAAESKLREKELAFQKEKEATRLRIHKEEKQAEDDRRREAKIEEINKEILNSMDRRQEIYMKLVESLMQTTQTQSLRPFYQRQTRVSNPLINDYLAANPKSASGGQKEELERARPPTRENPKAPPVVDQWQVFETTTI